MPATINNPVQVLVAITEDASGGNRVTVVVPRYGTLVQLIATTSVGEALNVECRHNGSIISIFGTGASGGDTATAANLAPTEVTWAAGDVLTVETDSATARGTVLAVFHPTPAAPLAVPVI